MSRLVSIVCVALCWVAVLGMLANVAFARDRPMPGVRAVSLTQWYVVGVLIDEDGRQYRIWGSFTNGNLGQRYKNSSRTRG